MSHLYNDNVKRWEKICRRKQWKTKKKKKWNVKCEKRRNPSINKTDNEMMCCIWVVVCVLCVGLFTFCFVIKWRCSTGLARKLWIVCLTSYIMIQLKEYNASQMISYCVFFFFLSCCFCLVFETQFYANEQKNTTATTPTLLYDFNIYHLS